MADDMNDQKIQTDQTGDDTQNSAAVAADDDSAFAPQAAADDIAASQDASNNKAEENDAPDPAENQVNDASDTDGSSDVEIIETDVVALFEKRLMEDLGFVNLPPEEEKSVKEKIEDIVNNRIINLMMIYMPEDKIKDFDEVIQQDDDQKTAAFVQENIPNWSDKVMSELLQLKDDLVGSK